MAKQGRLTPARRPRERSEEEESILLRSAETIGRMIGTLQRQLNGARGRLSSLANDGAAPSSNGSRPTRKTTKRAAVATTVMPAAKRKSSASKKTTRASKSTAARKTKGARKPR